ncbi:MAG TPA: four helix bundle protein [archaeon]|nr:four helix bundle protein [archaeon]
MSERINSFKDLRVWKHAYELALLIYKITKKFPKDELYGIVSQIRRAGVSVVSNIAEGYSRKGRTEYIQFLFIAYGSLSEVETQILLSKDLEYITKEELDGLMKLKDETGAMLYRLIQQLRS